MVQPLVLRVQPLVLRGVDHLEFNAFCSLCLLVTDGMERKVLKIMLFENCNLFSETS